MTYFLVESNLTEQLEAIQIDEDPESNREELYLKLTPCYNKYGDYIGSFFKTTAYKYDFYEFIPVGFQVYYLEGEIIAIP